MPEFETMDDFIQGASGTNEDVNEAEGVAETPPATSEETPPATSEETPPAAEGEDNEETPAEKPKPKTKPNPVAELRKQADAHKKLQEKIDGAVNRLTDGDYDLKLKDFKGEDGKVDYDALIEAMDEADVKARAESRGMSPELQKEIEKYEKEKLEVQREKARIQLDRQLNNFQLEMKLDNEGINQFISDAMKVGINPLAIAALDKTNKGTVALKYLHTAIYSEKIIKEATEKAVAEAKAKWEEELANKGRQPKGNPAPPATKVTGEGSKGMALEEFLASLPDN